MSIKTGYIAHLKSESISAKKMLERVPMDNPDWKPHEKSMPIGRLATHIAENLAWISTIINSDEYDFVVNKFSTHVAVSTEELLAILQASTNQALQSLEAIDINEFDKIWTVKFGDTIVFQAPKKVAIRGWAFDHLIHHRGQLSVYLRLLDIPVPNMYGPTADER